MFNKEKKFVEFLKEAYHNVKLKKFDKAIEIYNKIIKLYNETSEGQKTLKLKKDISLLYKELRVYLSVNDAYIMAQKGDFSSLEGEIRRIHNLTYDLEEKSGDSDIINYAKQHNKFFLEIYTFNTTMQHFEKQCKKVAGLIDEDCNEAMKEFSQLVILYNKLSHKTDASNKENMYSEIKNLYKNISIKKLFLMSRSKYRDFEKFKEEKKIEIKKIKLNNQENVLGKSFKELHDEIKKVDYNKVIDVYENI